MIETAQPERGFDHGGSCQPVATTSFLASRGVDWDLGRPVLQHKPLNRGAATQRTLVKVFDDPGMRPKVLHPRNNKRYGERDDAPLAVQGSSLTASHGSPALHAASRSQRVTNPMAPCYKLASAPDSGAKLLTAPPRFVRDSISVDDIEGARPRVVQRATYGAALDISDIQGSSPAPRNGDRVGQICGRTHNPLHVHDINTLPFAAPARATDVAPRPSSAPSYIPPAPVWSAPEVFGHIGPATDRAIATATGTGRAWAERQAVQTHEARTVVAAERSAAAAAGHAAFEEIASAAAAASVPVTMDAAGAFWDTCRAADRQGSGKVSAYEFRYALELAGVAGTATSQQLDALAKGWKDHAGYIAYRDISRKLLHKAQASASVATASATGDSSSASQHMDAASSSASAAWPAPPALHNSSVRQDAAPAEANTSAAIGSPSTSAPDVGTVHSAVGDLAATTSGGCNSTAEHLVRLIDRLHSGAGGVAGESLSARPSSAQTLRQNSSHAPEPALRRPASAVDFYRRPGQADDNAPRGGRISRAAAEAYRRATYHDAAGSVVGPAPLMRRPASAIDAQRSTVQLDAAGSMPRDRPSSALRATYEGTAMWFGGNEEGAPRSGDRPWSAKGETTRFMPGVPFLRVGSGGQDAAAASALASAAWPERVDVTRSSSTPRQRPSTATARFAGSGSASSCSHGSGRWGARPASNTARMQQQIAGDDLAAVRGLI